jgi:S-adenosylmethionine decarboxylase
MIGKHLLADFYGVEAARLDDGDLLRRCMLAAASRCALTPVAPPVLHRFEGGGVTAFLLLAESHIALHTYPERGFLALDIFSCGRGDPGEALEVFRTALAPERVEATTEERGKEVSGWRLTSHPELRQP